MRVLLLLLTASVMAPALAQTATVEGTVRDAEGLPLAGASVYLSGTTHGDAADAEGRFRIEAVPPGLYRLVASLVGYTAATEDLRLSPYETARASLRLDAATLDLGAIAVEAERDRRRPRKLAWFTRVLLGESANATETTILNPEVLDLRLRWGTLRAEAAAPLVIENRALGYRLTYDLSEFEAGPTRIRYHGDERFEDLAPADSAEAARWAAARERAYRGSQRHLLRALLTGDTEAEGFSLTLARSDPFRPSSADRERPVEATQIVRRGDGWGTLRLRGRLGVAYHGEAEAPEYLASEWFREARRRPDAVQRSSLTATRALRIDPQGTPEDPFALVSSGYFAFERLADLVPSDYTPEADTPPHGL
ncbi:MAG: carboxypeptidase-like regulatory domain-containing protein [Bacteroidota bacterium]